MSPRTFAVVGTGVGVTVLVAAGIPYASADGTAPRASAAHHAVRSVHRAAPPAAPAVLAGGRGAGGEKGEGRDGGGRDHGRDGGDRGRERGGKIFFNERTYSALAEGCITVSGSSSFSIFNDSRRTVEVFRGYTCDGGAPVTTVGPHGETYGEVTRGDHGGVFGDEGLFGRGGVFGAGGVFGEDGVVGSFRVVGHHGEW
ncbi:hypothetical protein BIV25_23260 [Streptomyces sp. MUSC 14]|uniref:hypothetical protein n=1 Tax=Streptomyces sp. MUSC 14 TaxID=1354889 RepID=UPI0008F5F145|nr:hypothetical protein [Streptomyces sp. MUSC 14]OIJ94199.1 hypothetical protein BIV25_23260 [Streptomyces sp. MUSC 14]